MLHTSSWLTPSPMLFSYWVILTAVSLSLVQSVYIFPSSTWRQETVVRTNVCPRRLIAVSSISSLMSTSHIVSTHVAILLSVDSLVSAPTSQVRPWQKYFIRTLLRLRQVTFTSALVLRRGVISFSLLTVKRISIPRRTSSLSSTPSTPWQRNTICQFSIAVTLVHATVLQPQVFSLILAYRFSNPLASMTTTVSR